MRLTIISVPKSWVPGKRLRRCRGSCFAELVHSSWDVAVKATVNIKLLASATSATRFECGHGIPAIMENRYRGSDRLGNFQTFISLQSIPSLTRSQHEAYCFRFLSYLAYPTPKPSPKRGIMNRTPKIKSLAPDLSCEFSHIPKSSPITPVSFECLFEFVVANITPLAPC
jgi:hypothetical protein